MSPWFSLEVCISSSWKMFTKKCTVCNLNMFVCDIIPNKHIKKIKWMCFEITSKCTTPPALVHCTFVFHFILYYYCYVPLLESFSSPRNTFMTHIDHYPLLATRNKIFTWFHSDCTFSSLGNSLHRIVFFIIYFYIQISKRACAAVCNRVRAFFTATEIHES